eukprot:m.41595 g.41595  ORF g.41595 m.41595 type:complete len:1445 (+) comp7009_c0_seq1:93-4427(+)
MSHRCCDVIPLFFLFALIFCVSWATAKAGLPIEQCNRARSSLQVLHSSNNSVATRSSIQQLASFIDVACSEGAPTSTSQKHSSPLQQSQQKPPLVYSRKAAQSATPPLSSSSLTSPYTISHPPPPQIKCTVDEVLSISISGPALLECGGSTSDIASGSLTSILVDFKSNDMICTGLSTKVTNLHRLSNLTTINHLIFQVGTNKEECVSWFSRTTTWSHVISLVVQELQTSSITRNSFASFSNLEFLRIESSSVFSVDAFAFRTLSKLTTLQIIDTPLADPLNNRLRDVENLEELVFSHTNMSLLLPGWPLKKVRKLVITHSRVVELINLTLFPAISTIDFSGNDIQVLRIPKNWENATITSLNLALNNIHTISHTTLQLINGVQHLNLSGNSITSLSSLPFEPLKQLTTLDLSGNRINELPPHVFLPLVHLESLVLDNNKLKAFDSAALLQQKAQLHTLRLGGNFLSDISFTDNFQKNNNLRVLDLHSNDIENIHTFQLPRLQVLNLNRNRISSLTSENFRGLPNLRWLTLETNRLTDLPNDLFQHTTFLSFLHFGANTIAEVPENVFQGLTQLKSLSFFRNVITAFHENTFRPLLSLYSLVLDTNRITSLHQDSFITNTNLTYLQLSENRITSIPPSLLRMQPNLKLFHIASNRITNFPATLMQNSHLVEDFSASGNNLRANGFPQSAVDDMPLLQSFNITDTGITWFPSFTHLKYIRNVAMGRHNVQSYYVDKVLDPTTSTQLSVIALSANVRSTMRIPSVFRFPPTLTDFRAFDTTLFVFSKLPDGTEIDLSKETSVKDILSIVFDDVSMLFRLVIGWEEFPSLHNSGLCQMFAPNVDTILVTRSTVEKFYLCEQSSFRSVTLRNMPMLRSIHSTSELHTLIVSGLSTFEEINVASSLVLDISGTNVPFSNLLCEVFGSSVLFANNMHHASFQSEQNLETLFNNCLENIIVLDMSGNEWLSQYINLVSEVLSRPYIISTSSHSFQELAVPRPILTRKNVPQFSLSTGPVRCTPIFSERLVFNVDLQTQSNEVHFRFDCDCAAGFKRVDSTCRSKGIPQATVIGIAIGCSLGTLVLVAFVVGVRKIHRQRVQQYFLLNLVDKKEQLIKIKDDEVEELKKAWEIGFSQIDLQYKLAHGAQGEVWKAEWYGLDVAVKLINTSVDIDTNLEFEKEIEFLRKTRHDNLVRFFGAGVDNSGEPFLVLELVQYGALAFLLQNHDLERLVHSQFYSGGVWQLKKQFALDIATGMEYIHSKNRAHRDLKPGNVLISSRLTAMITDFGCIKDVLRMDDDATRDWELSESFASSTVSTTAGTPLYMAPEILTKEPQANLFFADVFSFGILMWEVYTENEPDLVAMEVGSYDGSHIGMLIQLFRSGKRLRFPSEFESDDKDGVKEINLSSPEEDKVRYTSLAVACMAYEAESRPTFEDALVHLREMTRQTGDD